MDGFTPSAQMEKLDNSDVLVYQIWCFLSDCSDICCYFNSFVIGDISQCSKGLCTAIKNRIKDNFDGTTHSFTNLLARTFQGKKQLSAPKHVAIEKQLDDGSTDVVPADSFNSVSESPRTKKMRKSLLSCLCLVYGLSHMQYKSFCLVC